MTEHYPGLVQALQSKLGLSTQTFHFSYMIVIQMFSTREHLVLVKVQKRVPSWWGRALSGYNIESLTVDHSGLSVNNIYWINCMSYNNSTYIGIRKQVTQHLYKFFSQIPNKKRKIHVREGLWFFPKKIFWFPLLLKKIFWFWRRKIKIIWFRVFVI